MRRPTLSVVMPNYNHARYLPAALRAHLEQTVPPVEVIVVDDASTDDSCAVVERLAATHPGLRLIRLPRNGGVNAAMNRGLREARGDYVCFSAADDLVGREFAERSLEVLARHPTAGFCFSDEGVLLGDRGVARHSPLGLSEGPCMLSPLDMERFLRRACVHLPSHAALYRRDALLALGGFIEELRWIADWFVNYVLAFRHGACYVPQVLAWYRLLPDSYSARGVRQTPIQRALVYRLVDLLQSEAFRDVAPAFRTSALVPDVRARVLVWLLASPRHRAYLTPRLVGRLVFRGSWSSLKPYVPDWLRRAVGWLVSTSRRRRLAGLRSRLSAIGQGEGR
jgi:hypothetical protein